MLHQQDRAARLQPAQQIEHALRFVDTHARERLVEEQHRRIGGEAHGDLEGAPLAVRQRRRADIAARRESDGVERARRGLGAEAARHGALVQCPGPRLPRLRGEAAILADGHVGEHVAALKRPADPEARDSARRHPGDGASLERDRAGGGCELAGEQVDERGFPGAVGTDQRVDAVALDGEGDAVHGHEPAEASLERARDECGLSHGFSRGSSAANACPHLQGHREAASRSG